MTDQSRSEREALVAELQYMADGCFPNSGNRRTLEKAIAALSAQPQGEPVATVYDAGDMTGIDWHCKTTPPAGTKLYTAPQSGMREAVEAAPQSEQTHVRVPVEQLEHWAEYWNGSANENAMSDALEHILGEVSDLLRAADQVKQDAVIVPSELLRQLRHYTECHRMIFKDCGAPNEVEVEAMLRAAQEVKK